MAVGGGGCSVLGVDQGGKVCLHPGVNRRIVFLTPGAGFRRLRASGDDGPGTFCLSWIQE